MEGKRRTYPETFKLEALALLEHGAKSASQVGILGKVLEVAATQWGAFHVRTRAEQNVHIQRDTFLSQRFTYFVEQACIPG